MLQALVGLLTALPQILALFQNLLKWAQAQTGQDLPGKILAINQAFATLNQADTAEKKAASAKALSDLIHGL